MQKHDQYLLMIKKNYLQREIIYTSDSLVRTTNKNMGIMMEDSTQSNYENYHSHSDYQLMLLTKGSVEVVIADKINTYTKNDIVLLGRNLPHYLSKNSVGEGILIQFPAIIFPCEMNQIPDYTYINNLIIETDGGIEFKNNKIKKINLLFKQIHSARGFNRISILFQLLDQLGKNINNSRIISYLYKGDQEVNSQLMIAKCKKYLRDNLSNEITLQQIADTIHLNKSALCRAFRRETGSTIFQFIVQIRIESSLVLLRNTNLRIEEIAYQCGFNSLPYFNKKFKLITNLSPSEYRVNMSKTNVLNYF